VKKEYSMTRKRKPWYFLFSNAKNRCKNYKTNKKWACYKNIQCLITEDEVKELWFQYKAYEMKQPSIDRIDPNKDYTIDNCQIIELKDNLKTNRGRTGKGKLEEQDVLKIRESSESNVALAKRHGVSSTQIFRIKHKISWGWL
jgi:hypothetical protein